MTPYHFSQPGGTHSEDTRAVVSDAATRTERRTAKSGKGLAILAFALVLTVVAPSAFLAAPQQAHAIDAEVVSNTSLTAIKTTIESTFTAVKSAITAVSSVTSAAANYALMIDKYVLQPAAFVMSGNLLKAITAGVLDFVMGKTNGTGQPQFVTNLRGNLTSVSDAQAIAFFASFGKNSNSPFAAAITSSLRTNYYQQTSLAGFFAQNQCTLSRVSSNVNAFLAGNWSQGGATAWMALTTQPQNNPYLLQERAQTELSVLTASAVSSRLTELAWGQGFLSWCSGGSNSSAVGQSCTDFANGSDCPGELVCVQSGSSGKGTCQVPTAAQSDAVSQATCVNKDGTPGTIQTPGTTIKSYLDKALGSNIDKLANLGSLASDVNGILGNVATVMNTVNFATQLFGGNGMGLGSSGSAVSSYAQSGSYLGLSQGDVQANGNAAVQGYTQSANAAANSAAAAHDTSVSNTSSNASGTSGSGATTVTIATFTAQLAQFESSWNTISGATTAASSSTMLLKTSCAAQVSNAQTAYTSEVLPVFAQVAQASSTIMAAQAFLAKTQSDLAAGSTNGISAYLTDLQTLQYQPPTSADVAAATRAAQITGGATANPTGSLSVSGGTLVDQMNLITTNANVLKNACAP